MPETSLTLVRRFRASPERVFAACTEAASLSLWFGPHAFRVTHMEADVQVGGRLFFRMEGPEGPVAAEGTFAEVVPHRRVVVTWRWCEGPPGSPPQDAVGLVTFDIAPEGDGSRLTLTHGGFSDADTGTTHAQGWAEALEKLEPLLEDRT